MFSYGAQFLSDGLRSWKERGREGKRRAQLQIAGGDLGRGNTKVLKEAGSTDRGFE